MEKKKRCEYGAKCYRTNVDHINKYYHGPEQEKVGSPAAKTSKGGHSSKGSLRQAKLDFFLHTKPLRVQDVTKAAGAGNATTTDAQTKKDAEAKTSKEQLSQDKKRSLEHKQNSPSPRKKFIIEESSEESDENESGLCDVTSNSWTFRRESLNRDKGDMSPVANKDIETECETEYRTPAEKIKKLFLVDMPDEFYSFFEFCETLNGKNPKEALKSYGIKLVGPYDVLTEELSPGKVSKEEALCHWRFFMDPPEMQTIIVGEKGLHYGYWRDEPNTKETFVVSNTVPNCTIQPVAASIFGAAAIHVEGYLRRCTPFEKVKVNKVLSSLKQWAEDREIELADYNDGMRLRKKKVVAATFHGLGIVVPVQSKTEIGYRPLIETNANLKKICLSIIKARTPAEVDSKMEDIERLVNAANIANDEGDFGNALELGIDLFCMGSDVFDDLVEHLLTNAYRLLHRQEWAEVIKAHLKNRRAGLELSVLNTSCR